MTKKLNYLPKANPPTITSRELNKWLLRLDLVIEKHIGDDSLGNEKLAKTLATSERNLFRKVKAITGLSPKKYLRQYRLHQALKFLKNGRYRTVKETANAVGYSNVGYFIRQFEAAFGTKPLSVLQEEGWR